MTVEPGPVARALLDIVHDEGDGDDLATRICRACVAGADVDGAGMSVFTASVHRVTLAATDPVAALLEDLQFTLGEGACVEAAVSGRPVLVSDVHDRARTARWPMFAAAVAEQTAVRGLFALPLRLGTINLGVLDLYRDTPAPLRGHELRDIMAATDTATLPLLEAERHGEADRTGRCPDLPDLDGRPVHSGPARDRLAGDRAEVHQAAGMIVVQLRIPAQDAFVRLRAYAFARRRPLSEVSRDVVRRRLIFTPDIE